MSPFVRKTGLILAFITLANTDRCTCGWNTLGNVEQASVACSVVSRRKDCASELDHDALVGAAEREGHQRRNVLTPVTTPTSIPSRFLLRAIFHTQLCVSLNYAYVRSFRRVRCFFHRCVLTVTWWITTITKCDNSGRLSRFCTHSARKNVRRIVCLVYG